MRVSPFVAVLVLAGALPAIAKDEAPLPEPPTTPLPAFENPLHDAKVGETLRYRVTDQAGSGATRFYEERVLARKENGRVLVETVETNETGDKVWSVDPSRSGWRPAPAAFRLPADNEWKTSKQKDVIVYVGEPVPKVAVRATLRVLDEPVMASEPKGRRRERKIWYSHDVPVTGKVQEFPFAGGDSAERKAVAWDKVLSPTECQERAKRYRDKEEEEQKARDEAAMGDGEKPKEPEGGGDKPKEPEGGGDKPKEPEGGGAPPAMDGEGGVPPAMDA